MSMFMWPFQTHTDAAGSRHARPGRPAWANISKTAAAASFEEDSLTATGIGEFAGKPISRLSTTLHQTASCSLETKRQNGDSV